MTRRNVLVVLQADAVTGLGHALGLASRMSTRVFVLRIQPADQDACQAAWTDEALKDLLASAQQAGIEVSYHICSGLVAGELRSFVVRHGISLLIIGEEPPRLRMELERPIALEPSLACQILEVKAKEPTE